MATTFVAADGYLLSPPNAGFIVGSQQSNGIASITEEIPVGETVDHWTRMITSQHFSGLARQQNPQGFLQGMARSLASGCPGAKTSPVTAATVSSRPAARIRADCPRHPQTGLPETFWIVVVAGPGDLHVRQVALRRVPGPADTAWAERVLMDTVWCPVSSAPATCHG